LIVKNFFGICKGLTFGFWLGIFCNVNKNLLSCKGLTFGFNQKKIGEDISILPNSPFTLCQEKLFDF